jgi:uncharacterized protein
MPNDLDTAKPVNVVVISDTHVNRLHELPSRLVDKMRKADKVIHLGDYSSPELLNDLRSLGNFQGVIGNHDSLIARSELKVTDVIEIGGKRLGLIHGLFIPLARTKRIRALFRRCKVDIVLFGHNHLAINEIHNGVLVFNPGTVTNQFPSTYGSFGVLTLESDGKITAEIIRLENQKTKPDTLRQKVTAIFIRNAIIWLESWPYMDIKGIWDRARLPLRRFTARPERLSSRDTQ